MGHGDGLGTPNQMRQYVKDGTVKEFLLWDVQKLGYLASGGSVTEGARVWLIPDGYAVRVASDHPVVVQHSRLDTSATALALMTTVAHPVQHDEADAP
jgi:Anabaena sensory rhodopsin transducer